MGKIKRWRAVYDRVVLALWDKLSLWLRGMGAELGGTAFSLGMATLLPSCWFI